MMKTITLAVIDEEEFLIALDVLSIERGVFCTELVDEDNYLIDVVYDSTLTDEETIVNKLVDILTDEESYHSFLNELALNDSHCDYQQLIEMGLFK